MEGLCRASSSHSIADSPVGFNGKWPKTGWFCHFARRFAPVQYGLSTSASQSCDGIAEQAPTPKRGGEKAGSRTASVRKGRRGGPPGYTSRLALDCLCVARARQRNRDRDCQRSCA